MKGVFERNNLKISAKKVMGFYAFAPTFHSHMEILYVISGNINVSIDGITKTLSPGQLSIVFPYSVHSYERSDNAEVIIVMFSPASVESFEKLLLSHKPQNPYTDADKNIYYLLLKISELAKDTNEISAKTVYGYLTAALGEIIAKLELRHIEDYNADVVKKVLSYCSEHFCEDITIESISKALYISKSYVTKVFSSKLHFPFREYVNTLRISKAKKLLQETDKKIIEIMYDCGFRNQSSFNRIFFNMCGTDPRSYRKNFPLNII